LVIWKSGGHSSPVPSKVQPHDGVFASSFVVRGSGFTSTVWALATEGAELSTSASKLDPRLKRFDMDDLDARVYRAPPRASVAMSGGARSSGGVRARS
jgi:hypothetical protein